MILELDPTHCLNDGTSKGSQTCHRILLIEDSDDIQKIIRLGLELIANLEVIATRGDEDWLSLALLNAVDLILVDVPSDRSSILLELQHYSIFKDIPMVYIVSRDRLQDQVNAKRQGASAVIAKPFDVVVLASIISELLAHTSKRVNDPLICD
jgi:DNA-binding response OmpR family regulator